jgi:carboxypeptidase Taq
METKLKQLQTILGEVADLNNAAALLGWDQQTYLPEAAAPERGSQLGTLYRLAHERFTSDETGRLLQDLTAATADLDPDSDEASLVRVTARQYAKNTRVPSDLVAELAEVSANAHPAWEHARAVNDFPHFQPYLERLVELRRRYAGLFAPSTHVYDALLDDYEPGLTTADVQAIFEPLRVEQVALLQAIADRPQVENRFLYQPYDGQKQWDFGVEVITKMGYDWTRGRQDKAAHPFTSSFGLDDVRITTRILPNYVGSALFSSVHEMGHALYELGIAKELRRTPLAAGASLAIHESQSRLWENLVGRSLPFWEHFYPRLQALFPAQLGEVGLDAFYRGINRVEPSLIRVEADEATYNLHVMLRLELEIALMEGSLEVRDLPAAWNSRMQDYLGITPSDDSRGVLQDVHWSGGSFGYFSTYALGNLVSAQLWECIQRDLPNLDDQIRQGQFDELLGWLREKIHRHGAKFEPQELVQRVTGSKIDAAPYLRYLRSKFGAIYGL